MSCIVFGLCCYQSVLLAHTVTLLQPSWSGLTQVCRGVILLIDSNSGISDKPLISRFPLNWRYRDEFSHVMCALKQWTHAVRWVVVVYVECLADVL